MLHCDSLRWADQYKTCPLRQHQRFACFRVEFVPYARVYKNFYFAANLICHRAQRRRHDSKENNSCYINCTKTEQEKGRERTGEKEKWNEIFFLYAAIHMQIIYIQVCACVCEGAATVPLKLRCARTLRSFSSLARSLVGILLFYFVAYLPFSFGHFVVDCF